ncbi:hypothetical protein ACH5RR_040776 [Cinchona calisaya]|uniref:Zinc knuckle CX2CX4HX4C domain-containing protein n=1 Tax=Cinchona calisaya TaxID=153742 RepID=A0ABD2XSE9_9GENT
MAEVDLNKPLLRSTTVKLQGQAKWVEFRYEKCPDFCYSCWIIRHSERRCKKDNLNQQKEKQYGSWLRTNGNRQNVLLGNKEEAPKEIWITMRNITTKFVEQTTEGSSIG